jgi:hypothetical protein
MYENALFSRIAIISKNTNNKKVKTVNLILEAFSLPKLDLPPKL